MDFSYRDTSFCIPFLKFIRSTSYTQINTAYFVVVFMTFPTKTAISFVKIGSQNVPSPDREMGGWVRPNQSFQQVRQSDERYGDKIQIIVDIHCPFLKSTNANFLTLS